VTDTLMLGLRFPRSQARLLHNIATDLRAMRPIGVDISLFDKAAESATEGEPLVVRCTTRDEVERMAHGFTLWGVQRPAIDELNGSSVR
jgi:hypothetical protein